VCFPSRCFRYGKLIRWRCSSLAPFHQCYRHLFPLSFLPHYPPDRRPSSAIEYTFRGTPSQYWTRGIPLLCSLPTCRGLCAASARCGCLNDRGGSKLAEGSWQAGLSVKKGRSRAMKERGGRDIGWRKLCAWYVVLSSVRCDCMA
jgi:hypothetical protein